MSHVTNTLKFTIDFDRSNPAAVRFDIAAQDSSGAAYFKGFYYMRITNGLSYDECETVQRIATNACGDLAKYARQNMGVNAREAWPIVKAGFEAIVESETRNLT